ncbi:MAG TPA: FAD-dependent oxidoreductase [Polyangiaceae bacterium]|nr:FAD-dependent oxidoreductase [Polyangiaceae bacterium]
MEKNPVVAVLGGGVAGLSAAHELVERGFTVHVYEHRDVVGGKARSVEVEQADTGENLPPGKNGHYLPGEHGFRFFPSFYRHVTDTMKRIPFGNNAEGCYDNLVETTRLEMTVSGSREFTGLDHFPRTIEEFKTCLTEFLVDPKELGLTEDDLDYFVARYWQILTSSTERRWADYEKLGWWDYVGATGRSAVYQQLLAQGMTRSLVAANARLANTKSEGDIGLQLILDMFSPWVPTTDRVLNGPTSDVWIHPWYEYLKGRGVQFHLKSTLKSLVCRRGRVDRAIVDHDGTEEDVRADYYLVATPVEQFAKILQAPPSDESGTTTVLAADPTLAGVVELGKRCVASMNGIQFYLYRDVPVVHGHIVIEQSPWALTAISQPQFWPHYDLRDRGDGKVRGIISVDISDWAAKGKFLPWPARGCTKPEIAYEVWYELVAAIVDEHGKPLLRHEDLHSWYLDSDVHLVQGVPMQPPTRDDPNDIVEYKNDEPLFISTVNTWSLRPEAYTRIPNLFLAADYVRTFTQLATMEAANEAARRAVNAIVDRSGVKAPLCELWDLQEPSITFVLRLIDKLRYRRGLPWKEEVPFLGKLAHRVWVWLHEKQKR